MDKQDVKDYVAGHPKVVRKVLIAVVALSFILALGYCASRSEATLAQTVEQRG